MAEITITKLPRPPSKIKTLRTLNILFIDEIGQLSKETISVLDIILCKIRDNNFLMVIQC